MSLNYTTWQNQLANMLPANTTDPNFQTMLPGAIDYGEQRIYREVNLLANQVRDTAGNLTANSRTFTLPTTFGTFVSVQDINVVTPSSLNLTSGGTRNKAAPCSIGLLDFLYPSENAPTTPSVPSLYAMIDQTHIAVGAAPDAAYQVEVVGTIRPTPLSSANSSTFLTQNLPDLFFAATMIFASGYMRDFGPQADNSQMSQSWEMQYKNLFDSAAKEEVRKKFNTTYTGVFSATPTSGGAV